MLREFVAVVVGSAAAAANQFDPDRHYFWEGLFPDNVTQASTEALTEASTEAATAAAIEAASGGDLTADMVRLVLECLGAFFGLLTLAIGVFYTYRRRRGGDVEVGPPAIPALPPIDGDARAAILERILRIVRLAARIRAWRRA